VSIYVALDLHKIKEKGMLSKSIPCFKSKNT